jgi:hypothetical protein
MENQPIDETPKAALARGTKTTGPAVLLKSRPCKTEFDVTASSRNPVAGGSTDDKNATDMSDHLKEVPPAAVLLGREIISIDPQSGEVRLRFLTKTEFASRHGTVPDGMLAPMLNSATGNAAMANLPPIKQPLPRRWIRPSLNQRL